MGIVLAASASAARAQNSTGGAGIDAALRDAVARKVMQYLPFADAKALAVYDAFERGAYQLVSAER